MSSERASQRLCRALALACSLACAVVCLASSVGCESRAQAGLARALTGRGKVAVLGGPHLLEVHAEGVQLLAAASVPGLSAALSGAEPNVVASTLARAGLTGIVVDARAQDVALAPSAVAQRLARYESTAGLTGIYLAPLAAFYGLDPMRDWSPALRTGLAEVARRLVAGEQPPRLSSFPEAVRRVEPVEVMVLLRSGERPRLWRSARGSSFARALLTAASVARKRWIEREQAMGGSIDKLLPQLTIDVALLEDDGEIGARDPAFVDRVVSAEHGVAYENKGAWRYYLPEATHQPKGVRPSAAYARLFAEDGLPEGSLGSSELRPYRMAVRVVGTSEGGAPEPHAADVHDAIGDVVAPSEVLGDSN